MENDQQSHADSEANHHAPPKPVACHPCLIFFSHRAESIAAPPQRKEQMGTLAGSLDWLSQNHFARRHEFISPRHSEAATDQINSVRWRCSHGCVPVPGANAINASTQRG